MYLRCSGRFVPAPAILIAFLTFAASATLADPTTAGVSNQPVQSSTLAAPPTQPTPVQPIGQTAASQAKSSQASPGSPSLVATLLAPFLGPPTPAHGWIFDGDIDYRYRQASSGRTNDLYLNEGELDIGHPVFIDNQLQGNVFAQVIAENVPDASGGKGSIDDVAFGEAYANYHLPIQTDTGSTAYLQVGQFPLPVGLLPVYDTHLTILQTLAPEAIGERLDWGAEVQGRFDGIIDYRFAATSGNGPDHVDLNVTKVVSFRLGRLFATPVGVFNVGGSLLSGLLPVTDVDPTTGFPPILPPSGKITPTFGYVDKTRIVGDGTWTNRAVTARGEAMSGSDASVNVGGYFVMGEYRFAPGLTADVARAYWDFGRGNSQFGDDSIGIEADYTSNLVVRCQYEEQRDVPYPLPESAEPASPSHTRNIFTIQTVVRF